MTDTQITDKMAQMIRVGFVNARQPEKMRVKVTLKDTTSQELVTDWLPVLCPRACGDMQYDLPDIGDQVLCLFLAYGLEQGFVVGAMYGANQPPVQSGDKWHRKFKDGTWLEYDRESHKLTASVQGDVEITATGNMQAQIQGSMTAASDGPAQVASKAQLSLDAPAMNMGGGGGGATNAAMRGTFRVVDGDVIAEGVSLRNHVHICKTCGTETTPPVGGGGGASGGGSGGASGSGGSDEAGENSGANSGSNNNGSNNSSNESGDNSGKGENGENSGSGESGGGENSDLKLPGIVPGIINEFAAAIPGAIVVTPDYELSPKQQEALNKLEEKLERPKEGDPVPTDMDKLIFCLPQITEYMADEVANPDDVYGWKLLNSFSKIWLSGPANENAKNNPAPAFISWDWIMKFRRTREVYKDISDSDVLFNDAGKDLLFERLQKNNKLTDKKEDFDFITPKNGNYNFWFNNYFQSRSVPREKFPFYTPDGLMTAMGSFMLRALAKGTVMPIEGKYWIVVDQVAILATDSFNFDEEKDAERESWKNSYAFWNCNPPGFGLTPFYTYETAKELFNWHFKEFRRFGAGNDFIIFAGPHLLEDFRSVSYVWP